MIVAIGALIIAIVIVASVTFNWYSTQGTQYVFSPCPGLTVTSTATTGIWHCPNIPANSVPPPFTAGEFVTLTGTSASGYATIGCVPQTGETSCVVPQIASLQDYLYANINGGMWFVVRWKVAAVHVIDGQTVTVSGILEAIIYPSSPGSTFPVYHLNNQTGKSDLLQPQPSFEITNATLG